MSTVSHDDVVRIFVGILFNHQTGQDEILARLENIFGILEEVSELLDFDYTRYYEREMGRDLKRCFACFRHLHDTSRLVDAKLECIELEREYSEAGMRRINVDPGYVGLSKLVLASTKDFSHRIYVGRGIYEEITLIYRQGTFTPLQWTYPDYKAEETLRYFKRMRESLKNAIRSGAGKN